MGQRRRSDFIVPGNRKRRRFISWPARRSLGEGGSCGSIRRASTELSRGLLEGLCRTLPGALWILATDLPTEASAYACSHADRSAQAGHRQGRGEVPGLWRSEEGVCSGAVPEVSARVVRDVFVPRSVRLLELPACRSLGEGWPPEADAEEVQVSGRTGMRRSDPAAVRVQDSQPIADLLSWWSAMERSRQ